MQAQFHQGMTVQFLVNKITQNQTIAGMLRKLDKVLHGGLKLYASGFYDFDKYIPQRLTAGSFVHPTTGETIKKSVDDLEQDAVKCSVMFIRAADDYIKSGNREAFLKVVPNTNLDTGIVNSKLRDIRKRVSLRDLVSVIGKRRQASDNGKSTGNKKISDKAKGAENILRVIRENKYNNQVYKKASK